MTSLAEEEMQEMLDQERRRTLDAMATAAGLGTHGVALRQLIVQFEEHLLDMGYAALASELHQRLKDVAEEVPVAQLFATLLPIAKELRDQDSAATSHPIYVVEQQDRIYGIDLGWDCETCMLNEEGHELADADIAEYREEYEDEIKKFAAKHDINADIQREFLMEEFLTQEDKGCSRFSIEVVGYVDRPKFVTSCFTRAAAESYIKANAHNLKEPHVFVHSGYRNREWIDMRKAIGALVPDQRKDR